MKIREGDKERLQAYEGVVIARSGAGIMESFTVRKISYGEGVERVFPVLSPNIDRIEVIKRGKVRRAKLYYLRDRRGKAARIFENVGARTKKIEAGERDAAQEAKTAREAEKVAAAEALAKELAAEGRRGSSSRCRRCGSRRDPGRLSRATHRHHALRIRSPALEPGLFLRGEDAPWRATAEERPAFADELREEARTLLIESGLLELLQEKFGEAMVTGSAGYDLMAWRDIDIHMPCEADRGPNGLGLAAEIATTLAQRGLKLHKAQLSQRLCRAATARRRPLLGHRVRRFRGQPVEMRHLGLGPVRFRRAPGPRRQPPRRPRRRATAT